LFMQTSLSTIAFTNTSLASDCNYVTVSDVSREQFKGKQPQTLSSNFVNFSSFLFYAVKNSKGADIGVVIASGIVLTVSDDTLNSITLCVQLDTTVSSSDYPIYDFARR
jgi:hypothetical protein